MTKPQVMCAVTWGFDCALGGIRTPNLLIRWSLHMCAAPIAEPSRASHEWELRARRAGSLGVGSGPLTLALQRRLWRSRSPERQIAKRGFDRFHPPARVRRHASAGARGGHEPSDEAPDQLVNARKSVQKSRPSAKTQPVSLTISESITSSSLGSVGVPPSSMRLTVFSCPVSRYSRFLSGP